MGPGNGYQVGKAYALKLLISPVFGKLLPAAEDKGRKQGAGPSTARLHFVYQPLSDHKKRSCSSRCKLARHDSTHADASCDSPYPLARPELVLIGREAAYAADTPSAIDAFGGAERNLAGIAFCRHDQSPRSPPMLGAAGVGYGRELAR